MSNCIIRIIISSKGTAVNIELCMVANSKDNKLITYLHEAYAQVHQLVYIKKENFFAPIGKTPYRNNLKIGQYAASHHSFL